MKKLQGGGCSVKLIMKIAGLHSAIVCSLDNLNLRRASLFESWLSEVKHYAQRPLQSLSRKLLRQSNLVMQILRRLSPGCMILLPAHHFSVPWAGGGSKVCLRVCFAFTRFAYTAKDNKRDFKHMCTSCNQNKCTVVCSKEARKMWVSLFRGFVPKLATNTRHVSDQELVRWHLISPSYATFRAVRRWMAWRPDRPDLCIGRQDGEGGRTWEPWREEAGGEGGETTGPTLITVGLSGVVGWVGAGGTGDCGRIEENSEGFWIVGAERGPNVGIMVLLL